MVAAAIAIVVVSTRQQETLIGMLVLGVITRFAIQQPNNLVQNADERSIKNKSNQVGPSGHSH